MRTVGWLFFVVGTSCVPSTVRATDSTPAQERAVLDRALRLAGPQLYARLPLVLTSELPGMVSPSAEAWTVFDEHGKGERIFVYTRSRTFQCASAPRRDQEQCLLKLASVIVHEAWHLRNGLDEVGAYEAQLSFLQLIEAAAFLQVNEAAAVNIREVRRARDRMLADKRKASSRGASGAPPAPLEERVVSVCVADTRPLCAAIRDRRPASGRRVPADRRGPRPSTSD